MAAGLSAPASALAEAVLTTQAKRSLLQFHVLALDRAEPYDKLRRARQVAQVFMELAEAQGELERALVAAVQALQGGSDGT